MAEARHLVRIQGGAGGAPLFLVHSMAGELTWLPPLGALLGAGLPLYGFAAAGLNHPGPPHASIEAMAAAYLAEITEVCPVGPLRLGGYSFGGLVAFEIARQARATGRAVAGLALLDSHAPGSPPIRALPRWARNGTLLQVAANLLGRQWRARRLLGPGELSELTPEGQLDAAVSHLREHSDAPYPAALLREHLEKGLAVMGQHAALMAEYRLGTLGGEVPVLFLHATSGFVSQENPLRLPRLLQRDPDPTPAWGAALAPGYAKRGVPTEHFLMCLQPSLGEVARLLLEGGYGPLEG